MESKLKIPPETNITLIITILKSSSFLVGKMAIKQKKKGLKLKMNESGSSRRSSLLLQLLMDFDMTSLVILS